MLYTWNQWMRRDDNGTHSCLRLQMEAQLHLERPGLVRGHELARRLVPCCAFQARPGAETPAETPAHPVLPRLLDPALLAALTNEDLRVMLAFGHRMET